MTEETNPLLDRIVAWAHADANVLGYIAGFEGRMRR